MNTEDINTALKGVVSKAIEDIDTKFYNEEIKRIVK